MTAGELAAAIRATAQRLPTEPNVPVPTAEVVSIRNEVQAHLRALAPLPVEGDARRRVVLHLINAMRRLGGVPKHPGKRFVQASKYLMRAAEALEG